MSFLQTFSPSPILFQLGPLALHWYGLLVALGILAGYLIAYKLWLKSGRQAKNLEQISLWLIIVGFIGARLFDVFIFEWELFKHQLDLVWQIWQGGLAIHGALFGGLIVILWYAKKHHDSLWQILDIFAPSLALGQAIGRWGNYFNQELFGLPTNLPWGIYILPENRPDQYILSEYFHPVFLYESLVLLIIFWVLLKIYKKAYQPGTVFLIYLLLAGITRFILEFIRLDDQLIIFGLRSGMAIALMTLVISVALLVLRLRTARQFKS
ncbi:MAG: prolipoprotein diacylglyceryl transferase [Patescibacteria group bacterium]